MTGVVKLDSFPRMDSDENETTGMPKNISTVIVVVITSVVILTAGVIGAYSYAKRRTGTIVLPAGVTYLGPSAQSASPAASKPDVSPASQWVSTSGKIFPYAFLYPNSLSLGVFPNDPFDSVTLFWGTTNPQENIFFRVENLADMPDFKEFINKPKIEYVRVWYKPYNIWKGVSEIIEFTNAKGLRGYRAKYRDTAGQIPFDNVFFEAPESRNLMIWLSGRLFDQSDFDRIVDSVSWGK